MDKKILSFKINFLKNIGEMSEKKIELFTKEFREEFPIKNEIPQGIILAKKDDNLIKALLISPNQVTYSQEGDNVNLNFNEAKGIIKNIYDKLYLSYKCNSIYNFSCIIDGGKHLNLLKNKINLNVEGIQGIGIKIFLDNENYTGTFLFEPYIKNLDKCFCVLELQHKHQFSINEIIDYGKNEAIKIFYELIDNVYNQFSSNKNEV
ncbi:hypothetical protein [Clostridium sp.]|uniref:hypothetical protein n=1 Tax=Clostridium sp. TaxID=1506 RepID=UPI0035A038BD